MRNLITDIDGVRVGHAEDRTIASGVTAILFDKPATASIDVRGGGPGVREGSLLDVAGTVEQVDGFVLSGGSAFGLDAAGGVQASLAAHGRGFNVGGALIPIVPGAIMFDMLNGGDKNWEKFSPYRELGHAAAEAAAKEFALGSAGAGLGATTANLKGGIGSASGMTRQGVTVGAVVAVNAVGSITMGDGPHFWAAPFEVNGEFGGRGWPAQITPRMLEARFKGQATARQNTTIGAIVTDAQLTKAQVHRLAVMTSTGFARAIYPVHAPLDGDIIFAAATGAKPIEPLIELTELGTLAANVMARAIARGVYEATALPFPGAMPSWKDKFGR